MLALGCRSEGGSARAQEQRAASDPAPQIEVGPASWGPAVPERVPAGALAAELARDGGLLAEAELSDELRARGLWSLARVGGPEAVEQMLAELDGGGGLALAAAALF